MSDTRKERREEMVRQLLLASGIRGAARLVFALLRDRRVPLGTKLIVPAAVVYLISPIDFLPDIIPGLGQLDDLIVLLAAVAVFLAAVPRRILLEHLGGGSADQGNRRPDGKIIEGDYRLDDDDDPATRQP